MNLEDLIKAHQELIEKNGGHEAVSHRLIFQHVYFALGRCIDKQNERIDLNASLGNQISGIKPDLYLPKGCQLLGYPEKTFFEIKTRLIHNTLSEFIKRTANYKKLFGRAILVYEEQGDISEQVLADVKGVPNTFFYQLDEFMEFINNKKIEARQIIESEVLLGQWKEERKQIIDNAREAFRCNRVSFFVGAGVSQDAGGPSWQTLLNKVVVKFRRRTKFTEADVKKVSKSINESAIILGRYAFPQTKRHLNELSEFLRSKVLYNGVHESEVIKEIVSISRKNKNVESIITYNYDDLIEHEFLKQCDGDQKYETIYEKNRALCNQLPIYHVHGFIPREKVKGYQPKPILSEYEYHSIYKEAFHWSNVEQLHALDRNTCFFIGLSMTDPNLRRLLDISNTNSDGTPSHFVFMQRNEISFRSNREKKNLYNGEIIEQMMQDLGITIIWYESHEEIPELLRKITEPSQLIG